MTSSAKSPKLTPDFTLFNYVQFFAAGGLCATLTHGGLTPVDVVKTRLQLEPKGSKQTMVSMARGIVAAEGPTGLLAGFGPTAVGYLIQGGAKFAGYGESFFALDSRLCPLTDRNGMCCQQSTLRSSASTGLAARKTHSSTARPSTSEVPVQQSESNPSQEITRSHTSSAKIAATASLARVQTDRVDSSDAARGGTYPTRL